MSSVDDNRLKGNYGAGIVTARLQSARCLVRPVAADTDVGIDLYCETVEGSSPFLHFWVQVKTGGQCKLDKETQTARCSFLKRHLEYWSRQPVPVFAALVPTDGAETSEPDVYMVDITTPLLEGVPNKGSTTLTSSCHWPPGNKRAVCDFLERTVPEVYARRQVVDGIVASVPTLTPQYLQSTPSVPVARFQNAIGNQIRKTAASSVIHLLFNGPADGIDPEFHRLMASIVSLYKNEHWEDFTARGLSCHVDGRPEEAQHLYSEAIRCIEGDSAFMADERTAALLERLRDLRHQAMAIQPESNA